MTNENDMSDEELDELESKRRVLVDKWDNLELLRRKLNESHLEKMYVIKRATVLGPTCPYYLKARRLFIEGQQTEILSMINSLLLEFTEP